MHICDRCKNKLAFIKPLNTCNIIIGHPNNLTTYILCDKCTEELLEFLGEKRSNLPKGMEFWYSVGPATDA